MNKNNNLEQELDRLGEQITSQPSVLDSVMQRVETMEAPSARPVHRLGRIVMKTTMAIAASVLVGIAIWLGITSGSAGKAYGIETFQQRLPTLHSYHLKGWRYVQHRGADEQMRIDKVPEELYVGRPDQHYATGLGAHDGQIGIVCMAEDAHRYIHIDHFRKQCRTGNNFPFTAESRVAECLDGMYSLMQDGWRQYHKAGTERVGLHRVDRYEAMEKVDADEFRFVTWLDPATGLPVRRAIYVRQPGQAERPQAEYDLVEVDVPPPAELFTFEPPAGYEVIRQDRGPESAGNSPSNWQADYSHSLRFEYNIGDRAILVCWAWYAPSVPPYFEPDPANPLGQEQQLTLTSSTTDRTYKLVSLRTDQAQGFHWRWSLIIPEDGKPIARDLPAMTFTDGYGRNVRPISARPNVSRETLADFVLKAQRTTLPPDAPADAALTLEQIEAKIAELTHQS